MPTYGLKEPASRPPYHHKFSVEEIVEAVNVEEGQIVQKGAILATLFSTREALEVKRLGLMIDKAAEDLKTAQKPFWKEDSE